MICDTSGLIAALWADQPRSDECVTAMRAAPSLILSPIVVGEVHNLISTRVGRSAAVAALVEFSSGGYEVPEFGPERMALAANVMRANPDTGLSLAQASLVVLAKHYGSNEILTLDERRLRAVRGLDGRHFKLVPLDSG